MNNDLLAATTLACNRLQAQLSASSIADDAVSPRTAPLPRALAAAPGTRLPHALRVVDHQIDGMIRSLEHELRTSPHLRRPTNTDLSADALGAQLQKVLAGSRLRVERQVFSAALRQAEAEASASAARERDLRAQLSVTQLLTSDLASLGDQLRVAKNKLKARDAEAGEVVAAADELQQQSVGLAAALAEARTDRDALQQELESWRAACSFLEQRLAEERADARLSPPPREPPPRPPSRDASTSADTVDAAAIAADAPAAYSGDASTRGELARSLALDLKAAFSACVAVGVTGAAVARRVADPRHRAHGAARRRRRRPRRARRRAPSGTRAPPPPSAPLQRRPDADGSAAEVAALRELLQMALAMCDDALRHAAAVARRRRASADVASARRALEGCAPPPPAAPRAEYTSTFCIMSSSTDFACRALRRRTRAEAPSGSCQTRRCLPCCMRRTRRK